MKEKATTFIPMTHHRPDLDELLALWIMERFGFEEFPGLATAPIETVDAGLSLKRGETGDDWLKNGYVIIGAMGGKFDEHGKGDGKSAATLAAEYFGVTENKGLKPILAYALQADDKANDAPFNLARVIKDMHSAGVPLEKARGMHDRCIDALYSVFMDHYERGREMRSLKAIAIDWFLERFEMKLESEPICTFQEVMDVEDIKGQLTDEMTGELSHIQRYLDQQVDEEDPFSFAGWVYAMQMAGVPDGVVVEDARYVLNAKVFVQQQFMRAIDDFAKNATFLDDCPLKVAIIRSDNEQMNRAARASQQGLALLVQVRSSGHVQIFSDHRRDLRPVLARLRAFETYQAHGKELPPWKLHLSGTLPEIPEWYGFEKYGKIIGIFNSTVKTRRVPKTHLPLDEIAKCVRGGLAHTHRARGVERTSNSSLSA